ncbi:acyl-homoserine-lactone synthase [Loktanella sp. DJP18]|uniref:acyl-homoserine-lactone synthase n=1 Tax=Loktanella sp. DJP18 TaxID=3409788 RepID=UPI003BB6ED4A
MEVRTITFQTLGRDGALFGELLRTRKRTFIDEMGWALPTALGMEFDQYDNPFSSWVVVHCGDDIYGGVRLTPTTADVMGSSYMIRDAQRGVLPGMPSDLLEDVAPVSAGVWEASRVFIKGDRAAGIDRRVVRDMLLREMLKTSYDGGAERLVCILPSWWPRLTRSGLTVRAIGPKIDIGGMHQAVEIDVLASPLRSDRGPSFSIAQR